MKSEPLLKDMETEVKKFKWFGYSTPFIQRAVQGLKDYHYVQMDAIDKQLEEGFYVQKDYQRINSKRLWHIEALTKIDKWFPAFKEAEK